MSPLLKREIANFWQSLMICRMDCLSMEYVVRWVIVFELAYCMLDVNVRKRWRAYMANFHWIARLSRLTFSRWIGHQAWSLASVWTLVLHWARSGASVRTFLKAQNTDLKVGRFTYMCMSFSLSSLHYWILEDRTKPVNCLHTLALLLRRCKLIWKLYSEMQIVTGHCSH